MQPPPSDFCHCFVIVLIFETPFFVNSKSLIGLGMLGLEDLHYYAKNHSTSYQRVLATSHRDSAWYGTLHLTFESCFSLMLCIIGRFSMAIVGINITDFTISLVRTRQLQKYFYSFGSTKECYHEFYCKFIISPHSFLLLV